MIYILLIAALAVIDQIIKFAVVKNPGMGNSIAVIDNFFYISCIENDGIAMGMMSGKQIAVIIFTSVLMAAISVFVVINRKKQHPFLLTCLAMIVGGGIGNLIDRVRLGYVVDFLDFRVWSYIFNFADICVVVGCFAILFYVLFEEKFFVKAKEDAVFGENGEPAADSGEQETEPDAESEKESTEAEEIGAAE